MNGTCRPAYSGVTILAPNAGTSVAASSVIAARATLDLAAGFTGANHPNSLLFDVPNVDTGTLTRQGGEYVGSVLVPAATPPGVYRLTVTFGSGASLVSANRLFDVVGPPLPVVRFSIDAGQRDQTVVAQVSVDRPLSSASLSVGGVGGTTTTQGTCTTAGLSCASGAGCQCFQVDLSQTAVPGLTATLPVTTAVVDGFGLAADAGTTFAVTRLRWLLPAESTSEVGATHPALDSAGNVYVAEFGLTPRLKKVSPAGAIVGQIETSGRSAQVAVASTPSGEVAFTAWGGGGTAALQAWLTSSLLRADSTSVLSAGAAQAPALLSTSPPSAVTVVNGQSQPFTAPARLLSNNLIALTAIDLGQQEVSFVDSRPPNLVATGVTAWALTVAGSGQPTLSSFSAGAFNAGPPGQPLGPARGMVVRNGFPFVTTEAVTWSPPWNAGLWSIESQPVTPGLPAVRGNDNRVMGGDTGLVERGSTTTTIRSTSSPITTSPVLGRAPTGTSAGQGFAVTTSNEVVVFEGTTYRYSMQLPMQGTPLHPTLDCNRARPGTGTGVLYVATTRNELAAIVVDAPGLDPTATWPRYQRTAANAGNNDPSFMLNPGCP